MNSEETISDLDQLSVLLETRLGLHFPQPRWQDLQQALTAMAPELGQPDWRTCRKWLLTHPLTQPQIDVLVAHLTVGETYFFRDPESLEAWRDLALVPLLRERAAAQDRRLRLWSAGCASGEEPYTLAMMVDQLLPAGERWNLGILGTDINVQSLEKARLGVYGNWSFRGTPAAWCERYFAPRPGGRMALGPSLRAQVRLAYLNLAADEYPALANNTSGLDAIFCRNVLIYLSPEAIRRIVERFRRCLCEGGCLVVAPAEAPLVDKSCFEPIGGAVTTVFRARAAVLAGPPPRPVVPAPLPPSRKSAPRPAARTPAKLPGSLPVPALAKAPARAAAVPAAGNPDPLAGVQALLQQGQQAAAAAALEALLATLTGRDPASVARRVEVLALLARAWADQGRLSQAESACLRAVADAPLNAGLRYLLATVLQEQGQLAEARQRLRQALYLDPDFVLAHFTLGNLDWQAGRKREAARHFEHTLAILRRRPAEELLAYSEGVPAGRLAEIVETLLAGAGGMNLVAAS